MSKRPDTLRIAAAQLNPIVGDIDGNLALAREARRDAARQGADLVVFTELFLSGYSPEDLAKHMAGFEIDRARLLGNGMQEFLFRLK